MKEISKKKKLMRCSKPYKFQVYRIIDPSSAKGSNSIYIKAIEVVLKNDTWVVKKDPESGKLKDLMTNFSPILCLEVTEKKTAHLLN